MPLELQDVTHTDFPPLINCLWESYESPPQGLFRLFCPVNAVGATDRASAIKESTDRLWDWKTSDADTYWQKVIDTSSGNIIGGALWKLHDKNPHEHPENLDPYWQPEGGQRDFSAQALAQHEEPRERLATRAHVFLNVIFVHPSHRRRGAAKLILEWGIQKAAEMDVEMWLDAWPLGRVVYPRYGFTIVEKHKLIPKTENPDEAWKACELEWTNLESWVMWRPKEGPYVEGKSVKPWEVAENKRS